MNRIGIRMDKTALAVDRAWLKKAARAILKAAGYTNAELSVYICNEENMRSLNAAWRGKNSVTDVLTFAQHEGERAGFQDSVFGDLVICSSRAMEQAAARGSTFHDEMLTLLAHGAAHLAGYDHQKGRDMAREMREFEQKLKQKAEAALAARN
ncbi:MAG: rRNA maturation RNase YbeY [Spirochaetota bacterium]|jgi:probable rRNA maturation factor|nr:rRNA maturation RNase YbeY [Spirochaetota bacterium]